MGRAPRYRHVVFTWNNYTGEAIERLSQLDATYLVYGQEIGDSGTPHLQGYIEFPGQRTVKSLLRELGNGPHFEERRGSPKQASEYCKKGEQPHDEWTSLGTSGPSYGKNAVITERGVMSRQGQRTDLLALHQMCKELKSDYDMYEELPGTMLLYHKHANHCRNTYARKLFNQWKPIQVHVRWGPAGTGKTRYVYETHEDVYSVPFVRNGSIWFDGMDPSTKVILFDDYYGEIEWGWFLKLLDGYPCNLPVKGGFVWKNYDTVYITSNVHPSEWYPEKGFPDELKRRITTISEVV